jgi:NADH-quinone oxidoreductase subunit C
MATKIEALTAALAGALGDDGGKATVALGEVTLVVAHNRIEPTLQALRDRPELSFEILADLCGVDYSTWGGEEREGPRFAVVYHLLSLAHNWRLRVRCFASDDAFPVVASVVGIWPCANWYEREAFDLFGIMFPGHPDLRRILTDYGFVGHPFRKDFPISGHVEMRYDPEQRRVVYQPVSIEPREVTPRIVRVEHYAEDR